MTLNMMLDNAAPGAPLARGIVRRSAPDGAGMGRRGAGQPGTAFAIPLSSFLFSTPFRQERTMANIGIFFGTDQKYPDN